MKNWGLWLILFAVCADRLVSWLPETTGFDPFPFYDILNNKGENVGINLQSYVYMIIRGHLSIIAIWLFIIIEFPKYAGLFRWFLIIEGLSLIDFFLIYEHSFMKLWFYNLEFTDIKIVLYTTLVILWRQFKL